ncbi:MAG TPA: hypothetical protein VNE58_08820 [Casimicrobiaceae bacterium]|nr:hypothetical protein [Casimicrobiaceae bacterium]
MQTQNYRNDTLMDDAAGADMQNKVDQAQNRIDETASKMHDTIDRVHRTAADLTDRVSTDGERMYREACDWVSAHPMQAVGGALLAGYLIGRLRS